MIRKFFTLKHAMEYRKSPAVIIAQECDQEYIRDGVIAKRTREYLVFKSMAAYYELINKYPHCHEVIHRDTDGLVTGRIIFDFDFKTSKIKDDFMFSIEQTVIDTFNTFYVDVPVSQIEFVWQRTEHQSGKYSRHLTIKGLDLSKDWVIQLRIFYDLFEMVARNSGRFEYITEEDLIDKQVARENATMRMPLNSKLGGKPLIFLDNKYNFFDGLVTQHIYDDIVGDYAINEDNYNMEAIKDIKYLYKKYFVVEEKPSINPIVCSMPSITSRLRSIMLMPKFKNIFEVNKITDNRIDLIRKNSSICPISGRRHDNDNAFLIWDIKERKFMFFCRRGCRTEKDKSYIEIGRTSGIHIDPQRNL